MSYSISKFEKELYDCNIYEIVKIVLREMVIMEERTNFAKGKVSTHILSIQDQ